MRPDDLDEQFLIAVDLDGDPDGRDHDDDERDDRLEVIDRDAEDDPVQAELDYYRAKLEEPEA